MPTWRKEAANKIPTARNGQQRTRGYRGRTQRCHSRRDAYEEAKRAEGVTIRTNQRERPSDGKDTDGKTNGGDDYRRTNGRGSIETQGTARKIVERCSPPTSGKQAKSDKLQTAQRRDERDGLRKDEAKELPIKDIGRQRPPKTSRKRPKNANARK